MEIEQEYIKNIANLVPRPDIALDVLTLAHDLSCPIAKLAGKIEKDPSLTANMLRLANSSYFGHMQEITSIQDIIVRLGLDTVKLIAISSASVGMLKTPQKAYHLEPGVLWSHSYATAILAEIIGGYAGVKDISALYTAALLHDIGKILLNRRLQLESINYPEIEADESAGGRPAYEQKLLHTDHARIGRALLKSWGLPDLISEPIGQHHSPLTTGDGLHSRIVFLANWLENETGLHASADEENGRELAAMVLGHPNLTLVPEVAANLEKIMDEVLGRYGTTATVFEL